MIVDENLVACDSRQLWSTVTADYTKCPAEASNPAMDQSSQASVIATISSVTSPDGPTKERTDNP